ncbi:MAG: hypothetical protein ACLP3Q_17095 [Streptosporangiaceae bacterium]
MARCHRRCAWPGCALEIESPLPAAQRARHETLRRELGRLDDFHDLPHALIHPDFGPANVLATPGDGLVLVDWTGARRGPRLASLGFLLLAAGQRDLAHVDAVVAGYRSLISLEPAELARLPDAIRARPLIFDCWRLGQGRKELTRVVADIAAVRDHAEAIAERARRAFAHQPFSGQPFSGQPLAGRPPEGDGTVETALALAAIRAAETARPDRLFADPLAAGFLAAAGRPAPQPPARDRDDRDRDDVPSPAVPPHAVPSPAVPSPAVPPHAVPPHAVPPHAVPPHAVPPHAVPSALPVLLSQVLVAYTIEFDNEFEQRMPHRTARGPAAGPRRGPWLVSLPMWSNFLQFVPAGGVRLGDVADLARITNLPGLQRWGYVTVGPDPADSRPAPPRRDLLVRLTAAGRQAQQVWQPLGSVLDERWRGRFGPKQISGLTDSLRALAGHLDRDLPRYLPVGGTARLTGASLAAADGGPEPAGLPVLLSRLLLAFAIEFELESELPITVSASALRVSGEDGVAVRDLPRLAGLSRESIAVSLGLLQRRGYLVTGPDPSGGRLRLARLTPRGRRAQDQYHRLLAVIEERWQDRFGAASISSLRGSLQALYRRPGGAPLLSEGLRPYPDGWRAHPPYLAGTTAMISDPAGYLPHYPAVSHRGGFPDGS